MLHAGPSLPQRLGVCALAVLVSRDLQACEGYLWHETSFSFCLSMCAKSFMDGRTSPTGWNGHALGVLTHIGMVSHTIAWMMAIATNMHSHCMDSRHVDTCIIGSFKLNSIKFLIHYIVWSDGNIPSFSIGSFWTHQRPSKKSKINQFHLLYRTQSISAVLNSSHILPKSPWLL